MDSKEDELDKVLKTVLVNPLADLEAKEFIPTPLEDYATHQIRLRLQYWKIFQKHQERIHNGIRLAKKAGAWPEPKKEKRVKKILSSKSAMNKFLEKGNSLKDLLTFTDEDLQKVYLLGVKYYEKEKIKQAIDIFMALNNLDQMNGLYWLALGLCLYDTQDYVGAAMAIGIGIGEDDSDLKNYLYLIDSLVEIGQLDGAREFVAEAKEKIEERKDTEELSEIIGMLEGFDKALGSSEG
jgi:tetratricopeptide (TPR) repeat protein